VSTGMFGSAKKLVPASELRRLLHGSHEQRIEETQTALADRFKDKDFRLIATRENEAVVLMDESFHRVELKNGDGAIRAGDVTALEVEVLDEANVGDYLEREAKSIVDLFFRGAPDKAAERMEGLVQFVGLRRSTDPMKPLENIIAVEGAPRQWKAILDERGDDIRRFLGDEVQRLEEDQLRPGFGELYDSPIAEEKLERVSGRVSEELSAVLQRITAVRDETEIAFKGVKDQLEDAPAEGILAVFGSFATDLIDDLQALHVVGSRAADAVSDVPARARLYDLLAEGLHDREVSSRFVVVVADRLAESR
jgi:hypothetical protein